MQTNVIPLLPPKRIKSAEYARNTWRVVAEEPHTKDQIMDPTYWAHAAQQLQRGDVIEVINDTESFFIMLYVQQVGKGFAKVVELFSKDLVTPTEEVISPDYEVKWKGPALKYCVIRKQDGEVIKKEMEKNEAHLWLGEFLKKQ